MRTTRLTEGADEAQNWTANCQIISPPSQQHPENPSDPHQTHGFHNEVKLFPRNTVDGLDVNISATASSMKACLFKPINLTKHNPFMHSIIIVQF